MNPRSRIPILGEKDGDKHRIMLASRGIPAKIPADRVRAHLQSLTDIGIRPTMIARAAGVSRGVPERILRGEWGNVGIRHASALMSVTHMPHPEQSLVLSVGSVRRICALRAYGWTAAELSTRLGYDDPGESQRIQTRSLVTYAMWCRVRDVYDTLSVTHGGSQRAVNHARRQGWMLPMEWEGHDIDDPRVTPASTRRTPGRDRDAERAEKIERRAEVARLTKAGWSAVQIADQLGVDARTVVRDRSAR